MDIIKILQEDYQRFPINQTYSIYAQNIYFQDPLNKFSGVEFYKKMIGFMKTFFINCKMDLHDIRQDGDTIKTDFKLEYSFTLETIYCNSWTE
jgi:Uncharacterized conserved protein (DUF2358)